MKPQVLMGQNGNLAVGTPLYRAIEDETIANIDGFVMMLRPEHPLAYLVEIPGDTHVMSAEFLHDHERSGCEFLGDL